MQEEQKLDNPVWYSLSEVHKEFAITDKGMKFYAPAYCKFGSSPEATNAIDAINNYSNLTPNFFVVGKKPIGTKIIKLKKEIACNQMVFRNQVHFKITESITALQSEVQKSDLTELVNLVQPGYFVKKTTALGQYFGIYKNSQLIAAIGERMKMDQFTEISSVVTHPAFTRKGYARQLLTHLIHKIQQEGKTPYLHVAAINTGAIKLYEKLGFLTRRKIVFWNLQVDNSLN